MKTRKAFEGSSIPCKQTVSPYLDVGGRSTPFRYDVQIAFLDLSCALVARICYYHQRLADRGRTVWICDFQKMCILRILRMDSLTAAASSYVSSELGARFLEPPPFDLAQCYKDSTSQTPLIFILSQGSDPISELLSFAKEMKMSRRFESISLGKVPANKNSFLYCWHLPLPTQLSEAS